MKKLILAGAAAMLLSLGLFGCNNTAAGVSKDASIDGPKMASAAHYAGKEITAVVEVGPKVKLAIDADKDLNDTHNSISVQPKDGVVHLVGHVYSAAMKKKATADATKALKDLNATDKLSNELTVSGP